MQLPKVYEPGEYEGDIYALWEKSEAFVPVNRGSKESYSIVIPPPNANGNLHIGHGLALAIEDIAVRYHRMKGKKALLLPGADHAGFETQVVYEKKLIAAGKSRFDFSREELYQQIWNFVAENKENYESQFRRLGAGVDWSRYVFTLDEKIIKRANATFKKMWDDGLIYRGERLVNYCTFHRTGFADIEVEHKDVKGHLWHIRYPLTDGSGFVTVATTRPETMLGDTAVAVHPDDERFKSMVGKTIKLPLTNREIPILADDFVDTEFGTGAVKLTPAHDQNDFDAGERHDLPRITVINHEGAITREAPETFQGLSVTEARKAVIKSLEALQLIEKIEDYTHSVGHCYKCGTVIEPLVMKQWFINIQPLAKPAIEILKNNTITFHPDSKKQQLMRYLENLRDWNISRQIAWGIPIPAFQNVDDPDDWIYDERTSQEIITVNDKTYHRDPDVFDTWFSSSSWPYATLDYPDSDDFKSMYPLSLMETGADILYPWVSRMIMFGLYVTGKVPFETVYLHGLIQDEQGQKMSKSKGNVINPIEIAEEYGSDAFRMGIIMGESAGNNRPFDRSKVVGARNFCNKLWNIARFIEAVVGDDFKHKHTAAPTSDADHWMLAKLQSATNEISSMLENYHFSEASDAVYHLVWDDLADWYIEASKINPNKAVLATTLETILKLAHPFAPFVTETIWQTLKWENDSILAVSAWPTTLPSSNAKKAAYFASLQHIVTEIRYIQSTVQQNNLTLYHRGEAFLNEQADSIKNFCKLKAVKEVADGQGLRLTSVPYDCWLDISRNAAHDFAVNLQKNIQKTEDSIKSLENRLSNKNYTSKAPKKLINETKDQLKEAKSLLIAQQKELERFS